MDPGQFTGGLGVDGLNLGMPDWATKDGRMQKALTMQIIDVLAKSPNKTKVFDTLNRLADHDRV
jgi:hypothetical protein